MIKLLIPWLLFPYLLELLEGSFSLTAVLVVLLIAALNVNNLRQGFVIEWTLIISLIGMASTALYWPEAATFENCKTLLYGVLSVAGWSSIFLKSPFSMQYSRADVNEEARSSKSFFEI